MNVVTCSHCGKEIQIDKALEGQIEARVLAAEKHRHEEELAKVKTEAEQQAKKLKDAAVEQAKKQLEGEKELLKQQAEDELELAKRKLAQEQKKAATEQESIMQTLKDDAQHAKEEGKKLREQITELTKSLREERNAKDNAELVAQKKLAEEEAKIRAEVQKAADEKQRLNLAAKEKTITDLQKALDEAQRKAAQGSQQMQGEVMELDLEQALENAFRDDEIQPVAKGTKGGDILQIVKSSRGSVCGTMIWEMKRTKNWTDGWITKLKEDMRSAKASIPIIVTETMPKQVTEDMGQYQGVWVCKPQLTIIMAALLRKSLLDAGMQKALAENRGDKADALYSFVTSHEFIQQIESMVDTYQEMTAQVNKERVAYEKMWALRDKQAQKLLLGTATIIGSMQGHIGHSAMPRIKGLELDDEPGQQAQLGI